MNVVRNLMNYSFAFMLLTRMIILYLLISSSAIARITGTEYLIYKIHINGKYYKEHVVSHLSNDLLQYESCGGYTSPKVYAPGGEHCWDVLSTSTGQPRLIEYKIGPNNMHMAFSKNGHFEMKGFWEGKKSSTKRVFDNKVYVELPSLLRTMDLNQSAPVKFELIRLPELPFIKTHDLFVQVMGYKKVKVPAGHFSCKKILLSASGYKGLFFKAYIYLTHDERQLIVKIENLPIGGETELIEMSFEPV